MLRNQKPQEITEVLDPSQSEACCAELRLRVLRITESEKIWDRGAALPSRLHWFETKVLSQDENLGGLCRINRDRGRPDCHEIVMVARSERVITKQKGSNQLICNPLKRGIE
jgi:hypothetical protein